MSAISACIHCCNLARSCIAAHIFPANSACACAQNCNCCTPAPHFTCSTTSSDPPRQYGIHIYHTLHFPISISILKLSFLLLACLPQFGVIISCMGWRLLFSESTSSPGESVCLMGSSLLMHGERPLSATISSSGLHLLTLSTLGGHTLTLTPATFIRTKK